MREGEGEREGEGGVSIICPDRLIPMLGQAEKGRHNTHTVSLEEEGEGERAALDVNNETQQSLITVISERVCVSLELGQVPTHRELLIRERERAPGKQ